jgi:HEAT repeat protein
MIRTAVSLLLSLAFLNQAQRPALEFRDAPVAQKKATLNALAGDRLQLEANELRELLEYGLEDTDSEVRRHALLAVAGRSAKGWYWTASRTSADQERTVLRLLRPRVFTLMSDQDEKLRLAALLAAGNMDIERTPTEIFLGPEMSQKLAGMYASDPSVTIRREIIKTFALVKTTGNPKPIETAVLNAAARSDVSTVQYALMAIARLRLMQALPVVAEHLKGSDRRIRMAAAQSLVGLLPASRDYLAQLQQAAEVEEDDITKKTMLGSITALTRPE